MIKFDTDFYTLYITGIYFLNISKLSQNELLKDKFFYNPNTAQLIKNSLQ